MPGPEAAIEGKCRDLAHKAGAALYKIRFHGRRGFPDRMLVVPRHRGGVGGAVAIFIEFKKPGAGPAPHQEVVHQELRRMGLRVEVVDCVERFEEVLREPNSVSE